MWGRMASCAPVGYRRVASRLQCSRRVGNPPQVANLPHVVRHSEIVPVLSPKRSGSIPNICSVVNSRFAVEPDSCM